MADHPAAHKARRSDLTGPSKRKAKKILLDGMIRGKKLTKKQKRFFGARAGS